MPTKRNKLLILALFTLIISLSCLVDSILCVMTGGTMVWEGYQRGKPYNPSDRGDKVCDPNVDKQKYENWLNPGEADTQSDLDSGGGEQASEANPPDPQPAASQHAPIEEVEPAECSAPQSLYLSFSETETKDTENETRCSYRITYTNTGDEYIWVFLKRRHKGVDTGVEEFWEKYVGLKPGDSRDLGYYTLVYKNSESSWIDVVIRVAPITASEACKNTFRNDVVPREEISYSVETPCEWLEP